MGRLASGHDVVGLQEIRGRPADVQNFAKEFPQHVIYSTHCYDIKGGGIAIMMKKSFMLNFCNILVREVAPGRVLQVHLQAPNGGLNFVVVHIDPNMSTFKTKELWRSIRALCDHSLYTTFIMGDYNLVDETEGRYYPRTNATTNEDRSLARWFSNYFVGFTELAQDEYTHRSLKDDEVLNVSRIDRCYTDAFELDIMDSKVAGGVWGNPLKIDSLSDHVPITFRMEAPLLSPPSSAPIPRWLIGKDEYMDVFLAAMDYHKKDLEACSPWDAVGIIKHLAKSSASEAKEILRRVGSTTLEEKA